MSRKTVTVSHMLNQTKDWKDHTTINVNTSQKGITLDEFYEQQMKFNKQVADFMESQQEFNKQQTDFNNKVSNFMKSQLEFNNMILKRLDNLVAKNNLKE